MMTVEELDAAVGTWRVLRALDGGGFEVGDDRGVVYVAHCEELALQLCRMQAEFRRQLAGLLVYAF